MHNKSAKAVFLVETKTNDVRMGSMRRKLGFLDFLVVNAIGRYGGLVMLWKGELKVDIVNFSQ